MSNLSKTNTSDSEELDVYTDEEMKIIDKYHRETDFKFNVSFHN